MVRPAPPPAPVLLALLVTPLVALSPAPASAHTALVGSEPRDGATASPREVALSFDGAVLDRLGVVAVVGPDGRDRAAGRPVLRGRTSVVQGLEAPLAAGRWTVSYRVVAADGHPLAGQLAFTVPPGGGAAPSSAPAVRPAARAAAEDGADLGLLAALGAAAAGAAAVLLLRRRRSAR